MICFDSISWFQRRNWDHTFVDSNADKIFRISLNWRRETAIALTAICIRILIMHVIWNPPKHLGKRGITI